MLSFDSLTKSINGKLIFRNFGITLAEGSLLHIKGGNGAGKTTMLKVMAGIMKPDSGQILYANEPVFNHYREYCDMINYVSHNNALNSHLTIFENLYFWAKLKGAEMLVEAAMQQFGLTAYADVEIRTLSKGWQRRVALARLMLARAEIWLLDEPFTNLDINAKKMLCELIAAKCSQNGICVIASHEEVEVTNVMAVNIEDYA